MSAALGLFSQQMLNQKLLIIVFINIIVKTQRLTRASAYISPALRALMHTNARSFMLGFAQTHQRVITLWKPVEFATQILVRVFRCFQTSKIYFCK